MKFNLLNKNSLALIATLSLSGFAFAVGQSVPVHRDAELVSDSKNQGYTHGRCNGQTKAGKRCKRGVSNAGDRFCYQHK